MNEQVSCFGLFVCSLWPCRHIGLKYKKYCSQWNLMRSGDVRQLQWDDGIWEFFCKHGCNLRMNESIFSADTKRLLRYKNIPNFLQTCKLHWLLYDYNLNVWMCFSASKSDSHKERESWKLFILKYAQKYEMYETVPAAVCQETGRNQSLSFFLFLFKTSGHADLSSMSCFFHSELLQNKSPQKLSYKHQV